jgi:hypothetical protein
MQIQTKIIEAYPATRQIVARFSTPIATPAKLSLQSNQADPANPLRCKTDRAIDVPAALFDELIAANGAISPELQNLITAACPWQDLEFAERNLLNEDTPDTALVAAQAAIGNLLGATMIIAHAGTEIETAADLLVKDLLKIDADVDAVNMRAAGLRIEEYRMAEAAAQAYKSAGYTGPVSSLISVWTANNDKGLTTHAQAADDILNQAAQWRMALASMRGQRLAAKKARSAGVPNAMAQWDGFVAALRAQLFPNG